jgi:hypothetical protein
MKKSDLAAFLLNPSVMGWIVVGGIGLYALAQFVRLGRNPNQAKIAESDAKKLEAAGQRPTYQDSAYVGFAQKIHSAGMSRFGTDENAIFQVFEAMRNDLDIAKLITAFGSRRAELSTFFYGLGGWLRTELSASEINTVNGILAARRITYRF